MEPQIAQISQILGKMATYPAVMLHGKEYSHTLVPWWRATKITEKCNKHPAEAALTRELTAT